MQRDPIHKTYRLFHEVKKMEKFNLKMLFNKPVYHPFTGDKVTEIDVNVSRSDLDMDDLGIIINGVLYQTSNVTCIFKKELADDEVQS